MEKNERKASKKESNKAEKAEAKTALSKVVKKIPKKEAVPEGDHFPIVGIGASAGGLEAFTKLLERLPMNTGMAFVFIQHLAPGQESMLTDILARSSKMPVHRVQNDMPVEPNNVYVIPPNVSMTIVDRVLKLQRDMSRIHRPVDQFLISLAQDAKNMAIGVILSGTGSDGTEGLKAIYAEGGITFAQDEASAKYPGMPRSAVVSETVHFVLAPEKIAEKLVRIGKHPYLNHTELKVVKPRVEYEDAYKNILAMLKLAFNVNFYAYKESTLNRRISRRMVIHQIEKIEDYLELVRGNREELQALFDDLLIGVTSFFREPETFQVLAEKVYPVILKDRPPEATIRIWVPGCATGEEVYSLALSLREYMEKTGSSTRIQIFGTDISIKNIEKARAGIYPESISENVSEVRLKHFFSKVDQNFQINKSIRDMCVFATQDITRDPPFSNLDLISCRNLLIYLKPEAQKRVIPLFHYALKPKAFLVLGKSESISSYEELFNQLDKTPVYSKKMVPTKVPIEIELGENFGGRQALKKSQSTASPLDGLEKEVERVLMSKFSPPGVVVNNDLDVLLFHGNTSQFLLHGPGKANLDLMKMLRDELKLELQTAIYVVRKQKASVKREGIQFKHNGEYSQVDLEVVPIESPQTNERYFLVLFESETPVDKRRAKVRASKDVTGPIIEDLKRELASTKETLQTIIEEQEATNEELRAALEEVQSSNEELQSTNEELETAKEELQSTNEELNTVNEELTRRNKELSRAHDDLSNLFNNIDVTVIVLDSSLKIRLYTPAAEKLFNLIQADVGRPISDISLGITVQNFEKMLREVMENLSSKQTETSGQRGRWYEMHIRPYLTSEKKIDGVVLSLVDIDAIVRSKREIEQSRDFADAVLSAMREPVAVLDSDLKLIMANPSFYRTFEIDPEEAKQKSIYRLGDKQWQLKEFKESMEKIASNGEAINDVIIDHNFKIGRRVFSLSVRRLLSEPDSSRMFLLTMNDVTVEKQREEKLKQSKEDLERAVEEATKKLKASERLAAIGQTAAMVGHDIRNPLQTIVSATYLLKQEVGDFPENEAKQSMLESIETIEQQSTYIDKIVSDLQEFSRAIKPHAEDIDLTVTINNLLSKVKIPKNIDVKTSFDKDLKNVKTDPTCITRILTNLITNAVQAMPDGGEIAISTYREDCNAVLTVADTGTGIPEEVKTRIFQPLVTTKSKGQGFGLAVCKRLVEALKGEITFESAKGKGTKFIVKLPIE